MSAALLRASEEEAFAHGCGRGVAAERRRHSEGNPYDLIKPAAVASSIPAVSHSSLAVSKAVGQCWSPVPSHKAWREWHPAQDVPRQAKVQAGEVRAAGSIVEHGHSVALRDRTWSQRDGFKSAEEH